MLISQEVKGVIMHNMCGSIFYIKTNVLQDFHICMSVPLNQNIIDVLRAYNITTNITKPGKSQI